MNASNPSTPLNRLRRWWASPPRSGLRRIILPWEYRHLRFGAGLHIGGAVVLAGLGFVTLGFGGSDGKTYAWSLVFLLPAAANLAFALWELAMVGSADA